MTAIGTPAPLKFREPQADLYDPKTLTQRGLHCVGPELKTAQWADADGSRVVARVVAAVEAPPPADPTKDVQWLKVEAFQNFGSGVFSEVTFIQRVLTYGGQAPPSCDNHPTVSCLTARSTPSGRDVETDADFQ